MKEILDLPVNERIDLIDKYGDYLIEWYDTHNEGNPVCIEEFYYNEYQEMEE